MRQLIAALVLGIALAPCAAWGLDVFVQAEDYTAVNNLCPDAVQIQAYYFVSGLDCEGEWISCDLPATVFGTYAVTMRCWGNLNVPYHFHLVTMPVAGEDPQTIEISYIGKGTCGS